MMPPNGTPQQPSQLQDNDVTGRNADVESASSSMASIASWASRMTVKLQEDVSIEAVGPGLFCQCVIAGAADAATYSQTQTWAAFMTGNLTQLIMAFMTILMTEPTPKASILRLSSSASAVGGFIVGSFTAMLVDRRYGGRTRGKLISWSLWRAAVFMALAPCIALFGWNGPSGLVFLFIMAANMGSMAVNATKLGATPYATTVVFTATLASFFSDPLLPFGLSGASKKRGYSIVGLLTGGAAAQAIMLGVSRATPQATLTMLEEQTLFSLAAPQAMPIGSAFGVGFVGLVEIAAAICWFRAKREEAA